MSNPTADRAATRAANHVADSPAADSAHDPADTPSPLPPTTTTWVGATIAKVMEDNPTDFPKVLEQKFYQLHIPLLETMLGQKRALDDNAGVTSALKNTSAEKKDDGMAAETDAFNDDLQKVNDGISARLRDLRDLREDFKNLQEKLKASEAHVSALSARNSKLEADLSATNEMVRILQADLETADGANGTLSRLIKYCKDRHKKGEVVSDDIKQFMDTYRIKQFMDVYGLDMCGAPAK